MNSKILIPVQTIFRLMVGLVFIFSGFVKGIDTMGSAYKFQDYFTAFNLNFLQSLTLPMAIILSSAEFLVGVSLFFGLQVRKGAWGALIFMAMFLPLTFVIALTNPVSDCGCFGDALVITNWQTFWKNLIIIVFTVFVFIFRKKYNQTYQVVNEWVVLGAFFIFLLGFSIYGLQHLPVMDFRPYKTGASIPDEMKIPEGAPQDEYVTTLIYEKNGVQKEFTTDDFPWQDSTWKFIDQKSYLLIEGFKPPIYDFSIITTDGQDITDLVLSSSGYSFMLISDDLTNANQTSLQSVNELALLCEQNDIGFFCLTSSGSAEVEALRNNIDILYEFYGTDETALKTIIRSNPGLVLIKEGVILGKWGWRDFPEPEFISTNLLSEQLNQINKNQEHWRLYGLSVTFLLLWAVSHKRMKKEDHRKIRILKRF